MSKEIIVATFEIPETWETLYSQSDEFVKKLEEFNEAVKDFNKSLEVMNLKIVFDIDTIPIDANS